MIWLFIWTVRLRWLFIGLQLNFPWWWDNVWCFVVVINVNMVFNHSQWRITIKNKQMKNHSYGVPSNVHFNQPYGFLLGMEDKTPLTDHKILASKCLAYFLLNMILVISYLFCWWPSCVSDRVPKQNATCHCLGIHWPGSIIDSGPGSIHPSMIERFLTSWFYGILHWWHVQWNSAQGC